MNIAEAQLLDNSLSGLTQTLLHKRMLDQQQSQAADKKKLEEAMMVLRERELTGQTEDRADARANRKSALELQMQQLTGQTEDRADARANRKSALELQKEHQERLEALSKESNADKRTKMGIDLLKDLNKTGQLTPEALDLLSAKVAEQFGPAGIGVKLFQLAPPDAGVKYDEDPKTGERTARYGKVILKSGQNPDTGIGTLTEAEDPMGGPPKRTFRRQLRLKPEDLDAAMGGLGVGAGANTAQGPTAAQQSQMEEILSRPGIPAQGSPAPSAPRVVPPVAPAAAGPAAGVTPTSRPVVGVTHFQDEAAARAAGKKAGDRIMLWDPGRKTYRPFQLE